MTYTPKVGDRVRLDSWYRGAWADVTYIGKALILGDTDTGAEAAYLLDQDWQLVPPPPVKVRERWVLVSASGYMALGDAQFGRECKREGAVAHRLGVIDPKDIPDDIRVLILCDEDGTPANAEAVES